jgi:hypothetical protein
MHINNLDNFNNKHKNKNLVGIGRGKLGPCCRRLVKEMALVKRQCTIASHVFQQRHLFNMMNVNNCYMGNLVDEILNFFV